MDWKVIVKISIKDTIKLEDLISNDEFLNKYLTYHTNIKYIVEDKSDSILQEIKRKLVVNGIKFEFLEINI